VFWNFFWHGRYFSSESTQNPYHLPVHQPYELKLGQHLQSIAKFLMSVLPSESDDSLPINVTRFKILKIVSIFGSRIYAEAADLQLSGPIINSTKVTLVRVEHKQTMKNENNRKIIPVRKRPAVRKSPL
jgi:hypothetical protein